MPLLCIGIGGWTLKEIAWMDDSTTWRVSYRT
jgi:hypothetical protein